MGVGGEGGTPAILELAPGAVVAGDYKIVRLLARGGMGAVYVVEQLSTGKSRALKLMLPELAVDSQARGRFQLEARIGSKIESEHVVEIHSAGVDDATKAPYLVMELLSGEDLEARIERDGPLTPGEAALVFEQLCHAVAAAHDVGVVHRDLKPSNVFLATTKRAGETNTVTVKVLDFGIAKLVAERATKGGQTVGMIGTPLWMAPEQAEQGPVSPAADVWSLGLVLYFVLTGRTYWTSGLDPNATFAQILKEVLVAPLPPAIERAKAQGASLPPGLDAVFARSLVREPTVRFADARELADAVRAALPKSAAQIAAAPSTPRIASGGGALTPEAKGATELAAPLVAPKPIVVPAIPYRPARGSPSMGRMLLVVVACLAVVLVGWTSVSHFSKPSDAPPRPIVVEPVSIAGSAVPPKCKLCSGPVTANGPVARDQVVTAVERGFPLMETECLTPSPKRRIMPGVASIAFTLRGGRAMNRKVETTTSRDGADECLMRALADVAFPIAGEPTDVTYELRYHPYVRSP